MTSADVHGPIDFVLLEFPRDRLRGEAARALVDLIEQGLVRVYDVMIVSKNEDGTVEVVELGESATGVDTFAYFADARSGLLGDEDAEEAAGAMQPNTVAALIVYENTWAIPFVAAVRDSGGELVASARIPAADVMAALDAVESTS
jgi:Family of unknown function (DUF6325)